MDLGLFEDLCFCRRVLNCVLLVLGSGYWVVCVGWFGCL